MSPILRAVITVLIFAAMAWFVSRSITNLGEDMSEKTIKDGNASQIRYHLGIIKDAHECSPFKAKLGAVSADQTTDALRKQLMAINGEARQAGCLR
jgi:archaellum component FlaG (FlaF/FlaG flagellin family)